MKRTIAKIISTSFAVIVIAIICGGIAFTNSPSQMLKKQLALGQKYLNELDYDQAIVAFKEALKINPRSEDCCEMLLSVL